MAEPLWTTAVLAAAAHAKVDGAPPPAITGISIDTRTIGAGDLFVALKDQRDGHDFVPAAFKAGAGAALVRSDYPRAAGDGCLLRVDDPLSALERIGGAARARLGSEARVIAITGSAGKTGTKEMLRAALATAGAVHASARSYNNHWGVPLTLALMPAATRFAVLEMGMNHPGEITPLSRLARPHIAVITNVLPVHIGQFESEEAIADAKAEILAGIEPGGTIVLNADNRHFARLSAAARAVGIEVVPFGTTAAAEVRAADIAEGVTGSTIAIDIAGQRSTFRLGAPGRHLAVNALAVATVAHLLGLDVQATLVPLAASRAPVGRGERSLRQALGGTILLIDESYNANPASVAAALRAMASVPREEFPRRIAVLGDMLELGAEGLAYHLGLAPELAAAGIDVVHACGPLMRALYDGEPVSRRGVWAPASDVLLDQVLAGIQAGDCVMVKGSLGSRMGPIVDAIKKRFPAAKPGDRTAGA